MNMYGRYISYHLYMKNIELLYFTVAKYCVSTARQLFLSTARNWHMEHVGILFSVKQMTFFCWALEIHKKSVEQSRFKQLQFEQLTLTLLYLLHKLITDRRHDTVLGYTRFQNLVRSELSIRVVASNIIFISVSKLLTFMLQQLQ